MPFVKGQQRISGSGRKKGTTNKALTDVATRLAELGCDPIAGMAKLAADPKNTAELRGRMYSELAQYVYAKRRSIEMAGPGGGPITLDVSATQLLASRIAGIAERTGQSGSAQRSN